ncbi:MAG TPA: alpha amylase C-terminal domain-containing protein [Polyangiaceae bacterium]|nr:alpha amylase C-terminal domain-containing protein [Polyangiaceae bacterium]
MPASQQFVTSDTPLGATLVAGGATFRTWAPSALEVYLARPPAPGAGPWQKNDPELLVKDDSGYWAGFLAGVEDGDPYRFYVVGTGSEGFKRDPYARELAMDGYPDCDCVVRAPDGYRWRAADFRAPEFSELIIYQFHFGVFYAKDEQGNDIRRGRVCKFLDAVDRVAYWADLGVNAVMPLPFQEFQTESSLGYNGTDLFSPEMDYAVRAADLGPYYARVNQLLAAKGLGALAADELTGQVNQLKVFIDLCHLYGIAVIADVVYNHAGGSFDDQSLYFFDREPGPDKNQSLYFLSDEHAGGQVFAFWKREVRQFLIDNGKALLSEYRLDGLRYDQVTVIDEHGGWFFCQDLTSTLRFVKPGALQLAEYWGAERWKGVAEPPFGMGFDAGYSDTLRDQLRRVIADSAHGKDAPLSFDALRDALTLTYKDPGRWSVFQCIENHDLLDYNHDDKQPRIAALADPSNSRSWYARSRARVATSILLTAPGIPMLFMGQEFLEDKYWTDWQGRPELLIWWAGLEGLDKSMSDHHRFTRELLWLRRSEPALSADGISVFHVHNDNRVIAFQRWVPGEGRDLVVVASLNESTFYDRSYQLGFPLPGYWQEVFNSDVFDHFANPIAQGNPGGLNAVNEPRDGLPASAGITIPANGVVVFAKR